MVNTSCSAMVSSSKCNRCTDPSDETTVARSSVPTAGAGNFSRTGVPGIRSSASGSRMLVPPEDMSIVSPSIIRPSSMCTASGVTKLTRTVVLTCFISRATAVQTPSRITLKMHHTTFINTVPGLSRSQMKNRGIATTSPSRLNTSMIRNGCAIRVSKNVRRTTPPFVVTLNLPSFGLISASIVGNRM